MILHLDSLRGGQGVNDYSMSGDTVSEGLIKEGK